MTWEEKFQAIQALSSASVSMRKPGDWYVSQNGVEVCGDGLLRGAYGNGTTPALAIEDHWTKLTTLSPSRYIVLNAMDQDKRRHVRWNGFMWDHVDVAGYK